MKKVIRLTESDLTRIVKRVLMEQGQSDPTACFKAVFKIETDVKLPQSCMDLVTKPGDSEKMISCASQAILLLMQIGISVNPLEMPSKVEQFYECAKSKSEVKF